MQPNKKITDDLDYLSELGYNSFPDAEKDLEGLKQKAKLRFGTNSGMSSTIISLLVGLFIGITVFFTIYNTPLLYPSHTELISDNSLKPTGSLDTVQIVAELPKRKHTVTEKFIEPSEVDSAVDIEPLDPITTNQLNIGSDKTDQNLKYSPNAPIVYLHDIKIANYHAYYFNAQKMVIVHQHVNADKANKIENSPIGSTSFRDYYLHEAIDDAMRLFKKEKYIECIAALNTVSEYSKNDVNCDFYRGMCYYYLQKYNSSYAFLKLAKDNSINVFMEESAYYLALSAIKTEKNQEAKELLNEIAKNNDFYAKKALEILDK